MSVDHERCARNDLARGAENVLSSAPEWKGTTPILIGDHFKNQNDTAVGAAVLPACLDAAFRDAVANALRGGRPTFTPTAAPKGRLHSKELP
jgi:hypothetical protein